MLLLCAAALAAAGSGCAPDLERAHVGAAGSGLVGAACAGDTDCASELICVRELPGGACTRTCHDDRCPGDALCVITQLPDGSELPTCAALCDSADACRDGYHCASVGRRSVCSF